jgi:hypothetical protein
MGERDFCNIRNRLASVGISTLDPETLATLNPKSLACLKKKYENLSFVITCKFSLYYIFIQNGNGPGWSSRYSDSLRFGRSGDGFVLRFCAPLSLL